MFEWLAQCINMIAPEELASRLKLSPKTIYAYASRDIIPHYKIEASVRFRARDIAEWLQSRRRGGVRSLRPSTLETNSAAAV
jgi:excisionase family DNA binding protein